MEIIALYKGGFSGLEISRKFNISTDRVYNALKRYNIKARNVMENLAIKPMSFCYKTNLTEKEIMLETAAIMLYLGEGAKTRNTVDIANSDPKILKIFLRYLRSICNIDEKRLRLYLYCFDSQNIPELIDFWSRELNVSKDKFTKPYCRINKVNNARIAKWGVLHVRYNDKRLLENVLNLCSSVACKLVEN